MEKLQENAKETMLERKLFIQMKYQMKNNEILEKTIKTKKIKKEELFNKEMQTYEFDRKV
jgi:hypothetical protein